MRINLLTDAPEHNLALMKISAYHKAKGNTVTLNSPQTPCDLSYASWLYTKSPKYYADIIGGPGWNPTVILDAIFERFPDYSLYPALDYSLGSTWSYCPNNCGFCVVPKQDNPKEHFSISEFRDPKVNKICLLNNNTFSDPEWLKTFEEIWKANLTVVDQNGYDLRLIDDEKAQAIKKTHFEKQVHFSWDLMENEQAIRRGFELIRKYHIDAMIYVLIAYNTSREEDIYRCDVINGYKLDPYIMPYNRGTKADRAFKRFIDLRIYRQYKTIAEAMKDYR